MKVKCLSNKPKEVAKSCDKGLAKIVLQDCGNGNLNLSIGKIYDVQAIGFWNEPYPRYYIWEDSGCNYPIPFLDCFFKIVDARLSKYWIFSREIISGNNGTEYYDLLAYKEWVENNMFYENLAEGGKDEEMVAWKYKKLIEAECSESTCQKTQ